MTPAPLFVHESTDLEDAARLLLETKYCQLPVVDGDGKLTFNEKLIGKVVGDLMTAALLVVRESTNLKDAARLLLETKYRQLPVVDGDGKLVGIVTRGNVVRVAL
nr:cbs domain-containing protein cbsx2, chloroplastic [Quercus suber]